jgi:hypothetical protein
MFGRGGSNAHVPDPDGLKPGDEYPETGSPEKGTHSSAGVKVPAGTGVGGSDWGLSKQPAPDSLWISPDCRGVYEGPDWYEDTLVPAIEEHMKALSDLVEEDYRRVLAEAGETVPPGEPLGGRIKVPPVIAYAQLAGLIDMEDGSIIEDAIKDKPNSCLATSPWFTSPAEFRNYGDSAAVAELRQSMDEWATEYPALYGFFASHEARMNRDSRLRAEYAGLWDIYEATN